MRNLIEDILVGRRVESVAGGVQLDIALAGPVTVRVGHDFRFAAPTEVEHFYPALGFRPSGALVALVGRTVGAAQVTMAGGLELDFDGGGTLSVPPHAQVAPWSVGTPDGVVCTALAGGEVKWAQEAP